MLKFQELNLSDILMDENQPRKTFDESAVIELSESIKSEGVLQAILVRTHPKKKGKYLLVCGERRCRASKIAGKKTIPAQIRQMTDEEALQAQIVENLQRKDVHPMEEAVAFQSLHEKMTIEELANRVGKSPQYVAKRLKLNDLVEDAQTLVYSNHIRMTEATELSKLDPEHQQQILKEALPKDWKSKKGNFSVGNLTYYMNQATNDLSGAIFKAKDADLYPEAGACDTCPFNSANSPLLFDDAKKKICTKPSCFAIKTQRARKAKFEKVATDPDLVCIITDSYLTDTEKAQKQAAIDAGIKILDQKLYSTQTTEEPPQPYDEWLKQERYEYEDDDWEAPDDDDEAIPPIDEIRAKEDYEKYVVEQQQDYDEYLQDVKDGRIIEAYVVAGSGSGKKRAIRLKGIGKEAAAAGGSETDAKEEIAKIKDREKRNKELDAEKVWTNVRELINKPELQPDKLLNQQEVECFVEALKQKMSYGNKKWLKWLDGAEGQEANEVIARVARAFILDVLPTAFGSHKNNESNGLAYNYIKGLLPQEVELIEIQQQEVADARADRVKKRIDALKKKLPVEKLAPSKPIPGAEEFVKNHPPKSKAKK